MQFKTTLLLGGKTATGLVVPPEIVVALGAGKKPAVSVTLNGYAYRSTIATMDGQFMLPVSAEHREKAGIKAGDEVDVSLALDTEPRVVVVPLDFADALAQNDAARQKFEAMSYSHKRQHILAIEDAKTPETRQKRILKAIAALST
ncbi:MAG: YdeI/OmpD-associated family protein [Anaerolineae bacterium]|nr:YdeI/OmpD-associated family protein [Anaerolineae bacterium]